LIGEKLSSDFDHFSNIGHQNKHSANFDNFLSLGGYYGTNRHAMNPSFEIHKKMSQDNYVTKSGQFDHMKAELNKDTSGERNYLIISHNDNTKGRNVSIEEMKTSKCQSNHSPLLTKRKNLQRRTGPASRRQHSKKSIEKSKHVGLNMNLRSHQKASRSETRNTER